MKTYDRELELGFEVSAAKAIKIITRENLVIDNQLLIHQTWLEEGEVGDYKFRTRIRKTEVVYPDLKTDPFGVWLNKCEFTTKYSKNNERAAVQDNMELNAEITPEEYQKLKAIYQAASKEEITKIRTYFREIVNSFPIYYTLDTYPNEEGDRARIEIEFVNKEEMHRWRAPAWLNELVSK